MESSGSLLGECLPVVAVGFHRRRIAKLGQIAGVDASLGQGCGATGEGRRNQLHLRSQCGPDHPNRLGGVDEDFDRVFDAEPHCAARIHQRKRRIAERLGDREFDSSGRNFGRRGAPVWLLVDPQQVLYTPLAMPELHLLERVLGAEELRHAAQIPQVGAVERDLKRSCHRPKSMRPTCRCQAVAPHPSV